MAVRKMPISSLLQLEIVKGYNDRGKARIGTVSYPNLNVNDSPENILYAGRFFSKLGKTPAHRILTKEVYDIGSEPDYPDEVKEPAKKEGGVA